VRKSIVPGAVLPGRVVSVPDFGAFVDLGGGIQGLLHVSDMSWSRAATPGGSSPRAIRLPSRFYALTKPQGRFRSG
jgi:small subunit ribosomal protein S1